MTRLTAAVRMRQILGMMRRNRRWQWQRIRHRQTRQVHDATRGVETWCAIHLPMRREAPRVRRTQVAIALQLLLTLFLEEFLRLGTSNFVGQTLAQTLDTFVKGHFDQTVCTDARNGREGIAFGGDDHSIELFVSGILNGRDQRCEGGDVPSPIVHK